MKEILEAVSRISGRRGNSCYQVLCCAVQAAMGHRGAPMKVICREAGLLCRKREQTVCKALSRAARDIWDHGDRQALAELLQHTPLERPSPRDLIAALTQALRDRGAAPPARYYLLESRPPERYGFWCRESDPDVFFVVAPYSGDREAVARLVDRLNREQPSVRELEQSLLLGPPYPQ